jgi:NitT/TauT family transport system substrate-binding protein
MKNHILIDRRSLLIGGGASLALPALARSQDLPKVRLTLPWLAQGATACAFVAKAIGAYQRHGVDVEVSRGYGSLAAAQAIAQKQFEFGFISAGPLVLASARGMPLTALATISYDTTMGILVRKDSPIKTPKDLIGKRLGSVVTSAEAPFWPAYAANVGIDPTQTTIVQMDNRILERSVIDGQVDAITCIGVSSIPVVAAQKVEHRFFPFSSVGISPYAYVIAARPELQSEQPKLCQAITDALLEGVAFQLRNPEKALDLLIQEVPELGVTASGRENARISQGLLLWTTISDESVGHGLGWTDPAKWNASVDLTMRYAAPAGSQRPEVNDVAKNHFVGKSNFSPGEWAGLKTSLAPFREMMG